MNLKQYRSKALKPFVADIDPNKITALSLLTGMISGLLFALDYLAPGVIILALSGILDLLDGEIAKKMSKTSKKGDIFDHVADRIVDMCAFGGIALSSYVKTEVGLITAVTILMISYLGTQSQAVLGERLYKGTLGRMPRTVALISLILFSFIDPRILYYGIVFVLGLAILTVLERIWEIYKKI